MDKNEDLRILEDSKPSCAIRMMIDSCLGEDKGNDVWNRAAVILSEITNRYPPFTKEEYVHTKGIFNASALYLSLKEVTPDKALEIIEDGRLEDNIRERYSSFDSELGKKVRNGSATLEELAAKASELKAPKAPVSGRQEYLEGVLNNIILSNN